MNSSTAVLVAEALLAVAAILVIYWLFLRHRRVGGVGAAARSSGIHGPGANLIKGTVGQEDWPSLAREMAIAWLVVREGPGSGAHHMLVEGTNVIGRGSSCDIRLSDPTVSRQHARLVVSGDRFVLYDLQSTSGTLVDGEEVGQAAGALLNNGAVVRLGATSLVFIRAERDVDVSSATAAGKKRS
ncbi:MAG TPA: FHA domain-containing protein [Anaerolineae bacterium]|nr:FHA domain-containing protein [Anaerolineae bacterium]